VSIPPPQRVVLVGFMGCGKSTVGRLLADALGWSFIDQDQRVEEAVGLSVPAIFARKGEAFFRETEARIAEDLLRQERVVIASGGGWAAAPGRLGALSADTLSVWLRVSPVEAVRRAGSAPGSRPLLAGADPVAEARVLLRGREPFYRRAGLEVDTEARKPDDVTASILEAMVDLHPELSLKLRSLHAQ